ncbi:hypothetical protein HaLaN_29797, partial [Haematococcus lacustris]
VCAGGSGSRRAAIRAQGAAGGPRRASPWGGRGSSSAGPPPLARTQGSARQWRQHRPGLTARRCGPSAAGRCGRGPLGPGSIRG